MLWKMFELRFALEVLTAGVNDFFIFSFPRSSPVVGYDTYSSGRLYVLLVSESVNAGFYFRIVCRCS